MAAASALASPGGTKSPVDASVTASAMPPSLVPITAQPTAIASGTTLGSPSASPSFATMLGTTKAKAVAIRAASSGAGSQPASSTPGTSRANRSSTFRNGPSPAQTSFVMSPRARNNRIASASTAMPFFSTNRPAKSKVPSRDNTGGDAGTSTPIGKTVNNCSGTPRRTAVSATACETQTNRYDRAMTSGQT